MGPWKTGSTSLQNFFYRNRAILLNHGVLYPKGKIFEKAHHEIPNTLTNSMHRFENFSGGDFKSLPEIVNGYRYELKASTARTLLLSSEDFAGLNEAQFRQLLALFPEHQEFLVEIIYFDFNPEERFDSFRNQFIVQGEYVDEQAAHFILQSAKGIIPNLENAIKSLAVVIHRIDYSLLQNASDLYEKVLEVTLKDKIWHLDDFAVVNGISNVSIPPDKRELLNQFNKLNIENRNFMPSCPVTFSNAYPNQTARLHHYKALLYELIEKESAPVAGESNSHTRIPLDPSGGLFQFIRRLLSYIRPCIKALGR